MAFTLTLSALASILGGSALAGAGLAKNGNAALTSIFNKSTGAGLTRAQQMEMEYNAQQAQINRDWQSGMANTTMQRTVADAKAAGINPMAAIGGQMNPTPTGQNASAGGASQNGNIDLSDLINLFMAGSQIKNMNAQTKNTEADTEKKEAETNNINAGTEKTSTETEILKIQQKYTAEQIEQQLESGRVNLDLLVANKEYVEKQSEAYDYVVQGMIANINLTEAETNEVYAKIAKTNADTNLSIAEKNKVIAETMYTSIMSSVVQETKADTVSKAAAERKSVELRNVIDLAEANFTKETGVPKDVTKSLTSTVWAGVNRMVKAGLSHSSAFDSPTSRHRKN